MDRFKQIETFVRVAEAGSLAAAALEEGVSPVILRRRIDALEKRLGVKLMYRSPRRLVVSEECARRFWIAARTCSPTGIRRKTNSRSGTRGRRASDRIGARCLRVHARRAARAYLRARQAGIADVVQPDRPRHQFGARGLRSVDSCRRGGRSELRGREAGEQPVHSLRHVGLLQKARQAENARRSAKRLAFNLQGGQNRGWYFRCNGKLTTGRVTGNLDCNDGECWVSEGLGLGWRSTWEIQRQLDAGELETVLDDFELPDYDILAVYPQQRYVPARVRYFIDYIKEIYAQPEYWSRRSAPPGEVIREKVDLACLSH